MAALMTELIWYIAIVLNILKFCHFDLMFLIVISFSTIFISDKFYYNENLLHKVWTFFIGKIIFHDYNSHITHE